MRNWVITSPRPPTLPPQAPNQMNPCTKMAMTHHTKFSPDQGSARLLFTYKSFNTKPFAFMFFHHDKWGGRALRSKQRIYFFFSYIQYGLWPQRHALLGRIHGQRTMWTLPILTGSSTHTHTHTHTHTSQSPPTAPITEAKRESQLIQTCHIENRKQGVFLTKGGWKVEETLMLFLLHQRISFEDENGLRKTKR